MFWSGWIVNEEEVIIIEEEVLYDMFPPLELDLEDLKDKNEPC